MLWYSHKDGKFFNLNWIGHGHGKIINWSSGAQNYYIFFEILASHCDSKNYYE